MIFEIVSAIGGVPLHVSIEDGYEEVFEKIEVVRLSSEDKIEHVERPIGTRVG